MCATVFPKSSQGHSVHQWQKSMAPPSGEISECLSEQNCNHRWDNVQFKAAYLICYNSSFHTHFKQLFEALVMGFSH